MNMLIRYTYLITFAVSSLECFIHIKSNNKYSTVYIYTLYSIFLIQVKESKVKSNTLQFQFG